jgi:NADPH:quinone reductase-like Zn-dependent oxidoreductase
MLKRLTLTGSTLRARPADEKARLAAAVEATVWPWLERGRAPAIDRTFTLTEAGAAHTYLDTGEHVGKVVLVP